MARLILVAGAWHGAWCWEYVAPLLEARGHHAIAVELPGTGADRTNLGDIGMADWVRAVVDVINASPEPVCLIGHSRGGAIISQVAETVPDRINLSIYLTALMPVNGETAVDVAALRPDDTGAVDNFTPTDDGLALQPPGPLLDRTYRNSPKTLRDRAMSLVTPEPLFAFTTPLSLTADRFGRVPRAYIECLEDEVVLLEQQRAMHARQPCRALRSIAADHCPTYSAPNELADTLHEIIASPDFV